MVEGPSVALPAVEQGHLVQVRAALRERSVQVLEVHRLLAALVEVPEVGVEAEVTMAIEMELTLVLSEPELIA